MSNWHHKTQASYMLVALCAPPLFSSLLVLLLPTMAYVVSLLSFVLLVTVFATRANLSSAMLCGLTSALCFNYFLTEPRYSFVMTELNDVLIALVFLIVSMLIGHQTDLLRRRIDAQANTERELARARADKDRELLRTALTSSLSHDLKTPLATIVGAGSTLLDLRQDLTEQDQVELIKSMLEESRRLEKYIQNLLDMTRLGYGDLPIDRQSIDLSEIINVVRKRIMRAWPNARLEVSLPESLSQLTVHPALLEQAIYNLVDNAVKFNGPGESVSINARQSDDAIVIDIVDHGPGIPMVNRETAFDFFENFGRGDQHQAGEGLGLAIAKGMIGAHGGKLMILDTLNGDSGTCMRIELPIVKNT
ncbi:MAG: ATP-binding protein [Pseudohongiella sp.]|nr:ATP-binding protein [Pseudohongiella sp.]